MVTKNSSKKKNNQKDIITFIEDFCQEYLVKQAPKLPDNFKNFVYKAAPILNILGIVLIGLRLLTPFFVLSFVSFLYPPFAVAIPFIALIYFVNIINLVLMIMAAKGLFARYRGAWKLVFYLLLINLLFTLLTFNIFGIFRTIILGVIFMYIWFQVREGYKK